MNKIVKEYNATKDGDYMIATTPTFDRANDRVFPLGIQLEDFSRNPVLVWGHNYIDPWALIGRVDDLTVSADGIRFKPTLRPAANDADPMAVIGLLWDQGFVRASSIGFRPIEARPNERGGVDYTKSELLEISLTGLPMNQDALRFGFKGITGFDEVVTRAGRVLSKANEARIRNAVGELQSVLESLGMMDDEDMPDDDMMDKPKPGKHIGNDQGAVILALSEYFNSLEKKVKG